MITSEQFTTCASCNNRSRCVEMFGVVVDAEALLECVYDGAAEGDVRTEVDQSPIRRLAQVQAKNIGCELSQAQFARNLIASRLNF